MTQRTHSTYSRHAGAQKAARTKRMVSRMRENATIRATTDGHVEHISKQADPFAPDGTQSRTPYGMSGPPRTYYNIYYWRTSFHAALQVALRSYATGDMTQIKLNKGYARDYMNRIKACEGGKYEVASHGDPRSFRQQVNAKPATVNSVVENSPPRNSITPTATPSDVEISGEAVVSSNEPVHQSEVQAHQNPTKQNNYEQQYHIPHTQRRETVTAVSNDGQWLQFDISRTQGLRMLKWYALETIRALNPDMVQQETTPKAVEPAQTVAQNAAIECLELSIRAFLDAFLDGDTREAIELMLYAGQGMYDLCGRDKAKRRIIAAILKDMIVQPEKVISDEIESALRPPLPATITPRTDPADLIARAFGNQADGSEAA